jgi:RHS repeat-associated protein
MVKSIQYDSFGNILEDTNPSFTMPFGFACGLHDRDTGLVRFGYRDYDPEVGRWLAKDPIGFGGGDTDLYGYVLNDPVNFVDLIGLFSLGDAISWSSSIMIPIAKEGGLIAAKLATGLSIASSITGELVDPPALNADEDRYLHQLEVESEIKQYRETLDEMNLKLKPVFERFHVYSDELNGARPCP